MQKCKFNKEMGAGNVTKNYLIFLGLFTFYLVPASGINCYQCASTNNTNIFQCNEFLTDDIDMQPKSCDGVFGAKYCIKHVGRYEVLGLECYQCSSAEDWKCEEGSLTVEALKPKNCDYVYGAQHCIKTIGKYGGGIGTKRFCSSHDMGNYCQYGGQPGDTLNYRSCVYTCSTDGCNSSIRNMPAAMTIGCLLLMFYLFQR